MGGQDQITAISDFIRYELGIEKGRFAYAGGACTPAPRRELQQETLSSGLNTGPIKYWTDPNHVYTAGEMLICVAQYACPDEGIGFRYECPILIRQRDCELMAKFPLDIEEIKQTDS